MVGEVRLNFGWVSFKVRLMAFLSGIWYEKLIFLKIFFKEKFIYLKNIFWMYIYSGTPPARPPIGQYTTTQFFYSN